MHNVSFACNDLMITGMILSVAISTFIMKNPDRKAFPAVANPYRATVVHIGYNKCTVVVSYYKQFTDSTVYPYGVFECFLRYILNWNIHSVGCSRFRFSFLKFMKIRLKIKVRNLYLSDFDRNLFVIRF